MGRVLLLIIACLTSTAAWAAEPWLTTLGLANDGVWRQRVRVVVRNVRDAPLAGEPVEVKIGKGDGQADLARESADALRVARADGNELLWTLTSPEGVAVHSGPIPDGSALWIPAECPRRGTAEYFLYFDNPAAWSVPDFLDMPQGLRNGGMEAGQGDAPSAWTHDEADAQHRATWVAEQPHSGKKCLKTVVAADAEATWIATRQSRIRIQGGARYVLRGWVKAADVKGFAGWYIHVGNAKNFMLIAPTLSGGGGSYDWKQVTSEFTAPQEANIADVGSVLRGTGTAWFDDVELVCLDPAPAAATARAFPRESMKLHEAGAEAWPEQAEAAGRDYRLPIRVHNGSNRVLDGSLVSVDLSGSWARLSGGVDPRHIRIVDGGRPIESYRLGQWLLFAGRVAPRTARTVYAYFRRGSGETKSTAPGLTQYAANPELPGAPSSEATRDVTRDDYRRLLNSPFNRIKNAGFESGDKLPERWSGAREGLAIPGVKMGFASPGWLGQRCLEMTVPAAARQQWIGWRQEVRVEPERWYLLAAWLKCRGLEGPLQVHYHHRNARGELCRERPMGGVGPALSGTADWTLLQGMIQTPADAASLQVHLTMQAQGTAWHDCPVLAEVMPGRPGPLEARAAKELAEPVAWPVNAVVKVFRDSIPPAKPAAARITAARNEREPLQVAMRSPRALANVKVCVDPPLRSDGKRLADIDVGVVGYVPVDHPTSYYNTQSPAWVRKTPREPGRSDGWPGWWPDPVLPRDTFDLPAQQTAAAWITVSVPKDAAPGDYRGKVRFVAAGATVAELPFEVHVWDFALSDEMHVKAIYDCRQSGSQWAVPGKTPEQTRREFWKFMAQRRTCPDRVEPSPVLRYENGRVVADFKAFDEAADYYFNTLKLPHSYTPRVFYASGWGFPPAEKFGEQPYEGNFPFPGVDRRHLRPQYKQAYQACLKRFWEHIKEKGWAKKFVLYISDEPFDAQEPVRQQMKTLCDMIHEVDPSIPIYSSTWHHQPAWDGCLNVWGFGHYGIVPADKLQKIRRDGARLWWTTDGQMCIDTPYCAVERLLPHYCFKFGAEAYEFWGVDWLTYNPFERGWHRYIPQSDQPGNLYYVRYPNGDGYLAYPGGPIGHAGSVTSVRLEQAREGCEDYEYLYLLQDAIARARRSGRDVAAAEGVLAEAQRLVEIPNAGGLQSTRVLPDPDAVLRVKENVARAIEGLRHGAVRQ
jgi:hypothetical protein